MTSTTSLFYEAISGENKKTLKQKKKTALLKQQDNIQEYKEKLGEYKAKMGASGAVGISDGVAKGLAQEANLKNSLISQDINEKIIQSKYKRRKKILSSLGIKNLS